MTRKLAGLCFPAAMAACLVGCGANDSGTSTETDEFRNGVPRAETIRMAMPADAVEGQALARNRGQGLEESTSQALLGDIAEWYKSTRKVTGTVNGAAVAVGALVNLIIIHPPTTVAENEAVWGPWEDPLDPVAWKVTITRVAAHTFQYKFEGRPKLDANAAFVIVLSGTHIPVVNSRGRALARFGSGSFTLDWDARASLPQPPDDNVGKVNYRYDHLSAEDTVNISAAFLQVKDDEHPGQRVDANYAFTQAPNGPGSMDFVFTAPPGLGQAGSHALVHSRWQSSGAGRADVQLKTLDGGVAISESECWDESYASVYLLDSWPGGQSWGVESSCVFPTPEYSNLP